MQGNSFEDEIQRSLGGLKVHPSTDVWDHLEKELRGRKKRRFILFFSTLAGILLLGSAGYFYFTGQSTDAVASTNSLIKNESHLNGTNNLQTNGKDTDSNPSATSAGTGQATDINTGIEAPAQQVSPDKVDVSNDQTAAIPGNSRATKDISKAGGTAATTEKPGVTQVDADANTQMASSGKQPRINTASGKTQEPSPANGIAKSDDTPGKPVKASMPAEIANTDNTSGKPVKTSIPTENVKTGNTSGKTSKLSPTNDITTGENTGVNPARPNPARDIAKTDKASGLKQNAAATKDPANNNTTDKTSSTTSRDAATGSNAVQQDPVNHTATDSTNLATSVNISPVNGEVTKDSLKTIADSRVPAGAMVAGKDSTVTKAVVRLKPSSTPRWQWVGGISAGVGDLRKGKTTKAASSYGVADSPIFLGPSNAPGIPTNAAAILPPSESEAGFAFQVSGGIQYSLSRRSSVYAGLAYGYNSNRIRVGEYRNVALQQNFSPAYTTNARAYTGYPTKSFTDQYHLISLPVKYQFIINPASAFKVQWNAAVTPGYLIASDALVYSPALGGSYSRDKSVYNRFRLNVGTGFDILMGRGSRMRWSVGPEVSVSLRKLSTNPHDNQQYLYYGGLSGRIYFNR